MSGVWMGWEERNGILTGSLSYPTEEAQTRCRRTPLREYFKYLEGTAFTSLDRAAAYALAQNPQATLGGLQTGLRKAAFGANTQRDFLDICVFSHDALKMPLRLYANLAEAQKRALWSGAPVAYNALSAKAKECVNAVVFRQVRPWPLLRSDNEAGDSTELLPQGIPAFATLVGEPDVVEAMALRQKQDFVFEKVTSPSQVGFGLWSDLVEKGSQRTMFGMPPVDGTLMLPGYQQSLALTLNLADSLSAKALLIHCYPLKDATATTYDRLPRGYFDAVSEAYTKFSQESNTAGPPLRWKGDR